MTLYARTEALWPARFADVAALASLRLENEDDADVRHKRLVATWSDVDPAQLAGTVVFIHLLHADGTFIEPYSYPVLPPDRVRETALGWEARYSITLPESLPPGHYRIAFGLWRPELDGKRIPIAGRGDALDAAEFDLP